MPRGNDNPAFGADLMAYAGIPTFMRRPASRELDGIDVAIVGIPFDSGAASWRSGTRLGPRKIRENSLQLWGFNRVLKIGPIETLRIVDYGDVAVDPPSLVKTHERINEEVSAILAADSIVVALGGDHSISYPLLQAHAGKYGPVAVVHFDSHTDTYCSQDIGPDHGTPFCQAIEDGLIDTEAYIQVGIRGPLYEPDEIEKAEELGARVLTIEQCFEMDIPAVISTIRQHIGERLVYVSLDIDAVDPSFAPGTGTPEIGGFTSYQMLQMVRGLEGLNLIGFDLVEVNPAYDHGDVTAIIAANLVFEFLSLLALKK